ALELEKRVGRDGIRVGLLHDSIGLHARVVDDEGGHGARRRKVGDAGGGGRTHVSGHEHASAGRARHARVTERTELLRDAQRRGHLGPGGEGDEQKRHESTVDQEAEIFALWVHSASPEAHAHSLRRDAIIMVGYRLFLDILRIEVYWTKVQ